MRYLLVVFLMINFLFAFSQEENQLLVFNSNGYVHIDRGDEKIEKLNGETILKEDILKIINGDVTIINRKNKRITLKTPGTYSYTLLEKKMAHAESSMSTRYFVNVWNQMNDKHEKVNYRGGVVRGDDVVSLPVDSAYILSDTICFEYFMDGEKPTGISIKDEYFDELFYLNLDTNCVLLPLHEINEAKQGVYYYEFDGNSMHCFIIPDANLQAEKLSEYENSVKMFSAFDDNMSSMLIQNYIIENRIYVFQKRD